ncbi:MAG: Holliday junction branch migration DNA helicase RuvB [Proteobacteria bacterium]|nr:Holliday junction branch migration DNA helicase RuvB [Pseudomonadota bacterium]
MSPEPEQKKEHEQLYSSLRPKRFSDYPGQQELIDNMSVYVEAAKIREQALDHVLLHGPPGLGKTTLAHISAHELSVPFYATSGPALEKPRDMVGILTGLEDRAVLFIDEIHRLMVQAEEILYTAMEDQSVDIVVGDGGSARSVRVAVPSFTLIGATTKAAKLSRPLMSRFGIQEKLNYYDHDSLAEILRRGAHVLQIDFPDESLALIAQCSRGTPRIAHRLLRRVADFAEVYHAGTITPELTSDTLKRLGIDKHGLDQTDKKILQVLLSRFHGGPVGIDSLAMAFGEDPQTLEDVYEPYLVYRGYLQRTPRGRTLTNLGKKHLEAN